jgi:hypothetical protein
MERTASGVPCPARIKNPGVHEEFTGSVIAEIEPTNHLTSHLGLTYAMGTSGGEQVITKFEGEETVHQLQDSISGALPENTALGAGMTVEGLQQKGTAEDLELSTYGGSPSFQSGGGTTFSGGAMTLQTAGGSAVSCKAITGLGRLSSAKEGKTTLQMTGCTGPEGTTCSNAKTGEIETKELKSQLAYTYPAKETAEGRQTGLVLSPASGEVFAEVTCKVSIIKVSIVIKGAVIAVVTPLGKAEQTANLTLKASRSKQEVSEYETEGAGKVAASLTTSVSGSAYEESGLEESSPALSFNGAEEAIN